MVKRLRMVLHRGEAADAFWTRNRFQMGEGTVGEVAKTGEPRVSADLLTAIGASDSAVVKAGFRQIANLPLKSGEGVLGVLSVATKSAEPLDERGLKLLGAVGNWAGLALENARLHENAQRLAVLVERERIGMDLHDGIIQSVYGVGLVLENAMHTIDEDPALAQRAHQGCHRGLEPGDPRYPRLHP